MKKKTCDRCRALQMLSGETPRCLLGFQIDCDKVAPLEICPKPLIYTEFIELRNELIRGGNSNVKSIL